MEIKTIDEIGNADSIVDAQTLYRYTIECGCGEVWEWVVSRSMSSREIVELAAEEYWTLDDNNLGRCPGCLRKLKQGQRPKDPDNLGINQRGVLDSIRSHGQWHNRRWGCGWVWNTPGNTKRILDTLVKRGLVQVDEKGTYTPV